MKKKCYNIHIKTYSFFFYNDVFFSMFVSYMFFKKININCTRFFSVVVVGVFKCIHHMLALNKNIAQNILPVMFNPLLLSFFLIYSYVLPFHLHVPLSTQSVVKGETIKHNQK